MGFQWIVLICVLICGIIFLLAQLLLLRHSIREIAEELEEKLQTDTNTLLSISSGDRTIRMLASKINCQLRALRKERLRLQNGNDELTAAVTNISHDLRTPLTAICGYLDLLEQETLSDKSERYLAVIRERTDAMRSLTEELFRYSVIADTADELSMEAVCLNAVLEQSLAGFYSTLSARGITPEIRMPEKSVVRQLDTVALRRVLDNMPLNTRMAILRFLYCRMVQLWFPTVRKNSAGCRPSACLTGFTPWRQPKILPVLGCLSQNF